MELRATGSAFFSKPPPRSNFDGLVNIYDSLNFSFCIIFNLVFDSTGNDVYSGDHYSGNDGYSGLNPLTTQFYLLLAESPL